MRPWRVDDPGGLQTIIAFNERTGSGNLNEAIASCRKALKIWPPGLEAIYWEGRSHFQAGRYNKASDRFATFVEKADSKGKYSLLVRKAKSHINEMKGQHSCVGDGEAHAAPELLVSHQDSIMNMKRLTFFCLIIIFPFMVGFGEANHDAISVSIINLIATPDKYHSKIIRVIGVTRIEFEGNSIYLSREHLENHTITNAIWINPNYKAIGKTEKELAEFNGQYALVEGVFNKNDKGHLGLYSGTIDNITRFQPWPPEIIRF